MLCIGFVILWLFSCRNETKCDLIFMNLNLKIRNRFIFVFFSNGCFNTLYFYRFLILFLTIFTELFTQTGIALKVKQSIC